VTIEILHLLSQFDSTNDRITEDAYLRTPVPWIGPHAYLNVVFKPAPNDALFEVAQKLRMPVCVLQFLQIHNGVVLFSGALSVYGVHRPGQLLQRDDPSFALPFNIELENRNWPPVDSARFLSIGGYGFDGSRVCIDREDSRIFLFRRAQEALHNEPSYSWQNMGAWLTSEIARLSSLYDWKGVRLFDESYTLPPGTALS
jgi:hypothetical protein